MLIKIIGSILIVLATTIIGMNKSKALRERPKNLRLLKNALQSLEAEIMYGHTVLPIVSKAIGKQYEQPIGGIFETFANKLTTNSCIHVEEAWRQSLDENWKNSYLKKEEYEILSQFGNTLGKHDKYMEQKNIKLALNHLERVEEEAFQIQGKYEKMYLNLGFLSGLLVALLFV